MKMDTPMLSPDSGTKFRICVRLVAYPWILLSPFDGFEDISRLEVEDD